MRVIFAFVMIVLASFSLAQPMSQKDIFLVTVQPGSYGTVPLYGSKNDFVTGFRFTVTARSDGALPVFRQTFQRRVFAPWEESGGYRWTDLDILRKVDSTSTASYAMVARMPLAGLSVLAGNGLLLVPGEYIVRTRPVQNPEELVGAALLGGHYLDLAGQAKHWQLVAGRHGPVQGNSTHPDDREISGWLFSVRANTQGALPVVTQVITPGSAPVGEIEIWKKGPDETYFRYASWSFGEWPGIGSFMVQPAMPGLPLSEGEYVLRYSSGVPSVRASVGNLVLLSGFWSPRD